MSCVEELTRSLEYSMRVWLGLTVPAPVQPALTTSWLVICWLCAQNNSRCGHLKEWQRKAINKHFNCNQYFQSLHEIRKFDFRWMRTDSLVIAITSWTSLILVVYIRSWSLLASLRVECWSRIGLKKKCFKVISIIAHRPMLKLIKDNFKSVVIQIIVFQWWVHPFTGPLSPLRRCLMKNWSYHY